MTYPMTIAGIKRELPLCKVADDFYIGAFIMVRRRGDYRCLRQRAAGARAEGVRLPAHGRGKEHSADSRDGASVRAQANILSRARA